MDGREIECETEEEEYVCFESSGGGHSHTRENRNFKVCTKGGEEGGIIVMRGSKRERSGVTIALFK